MGEFTALSDRIVDSRVSGGRVFSGRITNVGERAEISFVGPK
jgi:hypothetical protein